MSSGCVHWFGLGTVLRLGLIDAERLENTMPLALHEHDIQATPTPPAHGLPANATVATTPDNLAGSKLKCDTHTYPVGRGLEHGN